MVQDISPALDFLGTEGPLAESQTCSFRPRPGRITHTGRRILSLPGGCRLCGSLPGRALLLCWRRCWRLLCRLMPAWHPHDLSTACADRLEGSPQYPLCIAAPPSAGRHLLPLHSQLAASLLPVQCKRHNIKAMGQSLVRDTHSGSHHLVSYDGGQ